ncbi:MAG: methyltransferase domain-containing protein [Alphaproteobacteria bacterium]|jgi:SAM-dependent methyltransferase|nr:methyltransferase domain-containing protein [Alphaproteobacteria bacterium]
MAGDEMRVFDRAAVRRHRDRAAGRLAEHDFLFAEVATRLADRLDDVNRQFPVALDLGCHSGQLGRTIGARGGIETLIQADLSFELVRRAGRLAVVADEEALPFGEARLDLVLSVLSLHWVNDLPGTLAQIRRALKPDGLFLAAILGGETLRELRQVLIAAETTVSGGAGPRVSPFAEIRDAGALLQRAGFALPVVDADVLTFSYRDPLRLMHELRALGEGNAVATRRKTLTGRQLFLEAARLYHERFEDGEGRVPATFEVLYLIGWAPGPDQPRPKAPGSAETRLAEALGSKERSAGEKAGSGRSGLGYR